MTAEIQIPVMHAALSIGKEMPGAAQLSVDLLLNLLDSSVQGCGAFTPTTGIEHPTTTPISFYGAFFETFGFGAEWIINLTGYPAHHTQAPIVIPPIMHLSIRLNQECDTGTAQIMFRPNLESPWTTYSDQPVRGRVFAKPE